MIIDTLNREGKSRNVISKVLSFDRALYQNIKIESCVEGRAVTEKGSYFV